MVRPLPLALLVAAAVLALAPTAQATSSCTISATVCQGQAYTDTTTGGLLGAQRCFFFDTDATLGNHVCASTQDRATWQANAGACVTLNYFDVAQAGTPPAVPNKVTLEVRFDNSATTIKSFQSAGAEPANGATFSFCATSDGNVGSSARAGTYRIYLQAIKDNGPGGVGNYNIDSDGNAVVGTITQSARGALRGNMLVASLTASAPPSGSTFAYGPGGDESVTFTATRSQKNGGTTTETVSFDSRHTAGGSILETTTTTESAAAATDTATSTIDNTYDAAQTTYDAEFNVVSNAALTSLPWTTFPAIGHGAGVAQVTTTKVRATNLFTADPRIVFDKDGVGTFATADGLALTKLTSSGGATVTLYNKGEVAYWETFLFNARGQLLSRAMTLATRDATPTTCVSIGSVTPSSNKYSGTFTIPTGATCLAANDATGSARTFLATNTDQSQSSSTSYFVSSFYWTDYHTEADATLSKDDFPTQDANEQFFYIISSDVMRTWCHLEGVRLDGTHIQTATNAVTLKVTETDDTTVIDTLTTQTGSDGWTGLRAVNPAAPSRSIHGHCDASNNGNTGTDVENIGWVSAFTADKICRIDISPLPVPGATSRIYIHVEKLGMEIVPDSTPMMHLGRVVAGAWTDASAQFVGATNNAVDNTATVNGALYYQDWLPPIAEEVNLRTMCLIQGAGIQQEQFTAVRAPTGGDPLKVFAAPLMGLPNADVTFTISESFTDGTARTGNAASTMVYLYNPSNTLIINGATPTEVQFGFYQYTYNLGANPADGPWKILVKTTDPTTGAAIGTANAFFVNNMNANTILPASIDLGGSAIPPIMTQAIYTLVIALIYIGAIVCLQFRDAGAKLFAGIVAALGAFLGFSTSAPLIARAAFIAAGFLIMAYAWWTLAVLLMAERRNKKNSAFSSIDEV